MSVVEAIERDFKRLPKDLAQSALAATAHVLATELDDGSNSATSKSMCAKALADLLEQLWALAPDEEGDDLDDLAARREARRRVAAAADSARS